MTMAIFWIKLMLFEKNYNSIAMFELMLNCKLDKNLIEKSLQFLVLWHTILKNTSTHHYYDYINDEHNVSELEKNPLISNAAEHV